MSAKTLFLFPGQGAQYPGIGSDLITEYHQAQAIYARASEILGYDLEKLCNDTNSGDINLTRYTQPVLLVHSFVCLQLFLKQCNNPPDLFATAGHSLGEYTALVAAGSLSFENALRLVAKRGECMGAQGGGEMLALSLSEDQVKPYLEASNCEIAALNLAEQTVIGGWPAELDQLAAAIDVDYPGKGGIRLKTEGAFHTSHMYPAAQTFKPILADTEILPPEVLVASNTTGQFHAPEVQSIRDNLYRQLFKPVRWRDNLDGIAQAGIDRIIEFGGGLGKGDLPADKRPNLQGMILRAFRRAKPRPDYQAVINVATLEKAINDYS